MNYLPGGSRLNPPDPSHLLGGGRREQLTQTVSVSESVVRFIGGDAKYEGVRLLFDGLQQPLLNKQVRRGRGGAVGGQVCITQRLLLPPQVTYVLLDIALQELFPELTQAIM